MFVIVKDEQLSAQCHETIYNLDCKNDFNTATQYHNYVHDEYQNAPEIRAVTIQKGGHGSPFWRDIHRTGGGLVIVRHVTLRHLNDLRGGRTIGPHTRHHVWNDYRTPGGQVPCSITNCLVAHMEFTREETQIVGGSENEEYHCGHLISVNHGGTATLDNLVPLCREDNVEIGDTDILISDLKPSVQAIIRRYRSQ